MTPRHLKIGTRGRWLAGCLLWSCVHAVHADSGAGASQAPAHAAHGHHTALALGAAWAPDGSVWVTGLDASQHLFVQRATDPVGDAWSAPQVLDTGDDAIAADGENHPKIAFGPRGQVVVSYTQPLSKPYTGRIRMLRSTDGGVTFSAPFTVHHDPQEITHRFESIGFDGHGDLHVVWIDKRDLVASTGKDHYVGAAIYQATSHDGGASFGADTKVADHSCECCRIALTLDDRGDLHAMWRHVYGQNMRDHAMANLSQPHPVVERASYDEWRVDACPHQGPGVAWSGVGAQARVHAVWFGIRQEHGADRAAVRYGWLDARGRPIASAVRVLPDPMAEHADVAAVGDRVLVVWRSFHDGSTHLMAWTSVDGGRQFRQTELAHQEGDNDHPRLISNASRMLVLWRTHAGIQTYEPTF